jgi:gliding motility-associated-like protein
MIKNSRPFRWLSIAFACLLSSTIFSQAIIQVTVTSVEVLNNEDCDGWLAGESDFVWEYTATDNTIGYTNNNPALFGVFNFNYTNINNNNGPYNSNVNSLFFDRQYVCPTDVPTAINLAWEAYENDDAGPYDIIGLTDGETGIQNVSMPVPAATGILNYSFTANGSGGGCNQTYSIHLTVERIDFTPGVIILPDNICDALNVNMNTTYDIALCSNNSLEANEPRGGDVSNTNSSSWFKFNAPASGEVEITTDLGGTEIGTYFQLYHAADGDGCTTGIQPITLAQIKDKFDYLSHVEYSDGIDLLGLDPEAQLSFDACDPIPLFSYTKLIAGETYYVQLTTDNNGESGLVQVRVNDLGGSPASPDDIPCLSSNLIIGTNDISSGAGDTPSTTIDFGCAFDGGNDAAETGTAHTNNDPTNYHAYDYNHPSFNNPTMNESVWLNFTAPNSGRIVFEADYQSIFYGENNALFGFDKRFAPGIPADFSCANLEYLAEDEGGVNGIFGGDESAIISTRCIEPGYNYYGMIDPSDNLTPLSTQEIYGWLHDPVSSDPSFNSPGNDILCIALQDTLYEVPVILEGTNPTFQAVSGSNVLACKEYLAGEPDAAVNQADRADQTVWHYFTAPASGAVEISIRAYVGLDSVRYNIYELLNGTDCYGGLQPATFTQDGTQNTAVITPVITGSAGYEGYQESACCMQPGTLYAIQIDGSYPGDEGQYIIEYIQEVESDAGDPEVTLANGDLIEVTDLDTAFICYGDTFTPGIMLNGIGESTASFPSCLDSGFVIHDIPVLPNPVANSGFETSIVELIQGFGSFINDTDGSGTLGNPLYNSVYYLSTAADIPLGWGQFVCNTSTAEDGLPVVYLQELNPAYSYDNATCTVTFIANGGLNDFYGTSYGFTITGPSGSVVETGQINPGSGYTFLSPTAGIYTVDITDGACSASFSYDASSCNNPCTPDTNYVNTSICDGNSIFLEGVNQTEAGTYTDMFITPLGCDSTVITTLTILPNEETTNEFTICTGSTIQVGTSTYDAEGVYVDTLQNINGCDSVAHSVLFLLPEITASDEATICMGGSFDYNGTILTQEGVYTETFTTGAGCDSTVYLSLFVTDPEIGYTAQTICLGESYSFGGNELVASGIFMDTIQALNGCDSIVRLELSVIDCSIDLQISNILTPNYDGQNDTWKVNDPAQIMGCDVKIFNRWGEVMYEATDYNNEWAGTRDGEDLPDGVYFYSITCSDQEFKGSINLLRFKK